MTSRLFAFRPLLLTAVIALAACSTDTETPGNGTGGSKAGSGGTGTGGSGRGGSGGSTGGSGGTGGSTSGTGGATGGSAAATGGTGGSGGSQSTADAAGTGKVDQGGSGGTGGSGGGGQGGAGGTGGSSGGTGGRSDGGRSDGGGNEGGPAADTWQNFALPFMVKYCASCHNDDNAGDAARNYRMLAVVMREKVDIACGVAKSNADRTARSCPAGAPRANQFPAGNGPKPTNDERDRLLRWIDANTP